VQPAVDVGIGGGTVAQTPFLTWRSTFAIFRYDSTGCGAQSSSGWKSSTGSYVCRSVAGSTAVRPGPANSQSIARGSSHRTITLNTYRSASTLNAATGREKPFSV
jgi:hypothetical protein